MGSRGACTGPNATTCPRLSKEAVKAAKGEHFRLALGVYCVGSLVWRMVPQ